MREHDGTVIECIFTTLHSQRSECDIHTFFILFKKEGRVKLKTTLAQMIVMQCSVVLSQAGRFDAAVAL